MSSKRRPANAKKKGLARVKPASRNAAPPRKPPAVYTRAEANAFLKREKAEILRTFDFRHDSVCRQRGLAICLIALGRPAEALQILDYAHGNVQYRGSASVWYAAGSACSVAGYLRRKEGQPAKAAAELQRFLDPPCHAIVFQTNVWTADFVRKHLAGERARFAPARDDPTPQFAIEARTWWIATLVFFRELALIGFPRQGEIDVTQLDSWIDEALPELAAALAARAR